MGTQPNIQTIEEPPAEYYLLDCEFATELNYQSKTTRDVPLEIAIGHYLNGKCLGYLAEYLYWPNMLARDLKRGIKHSGYSFDEYLKKGQIANIVEELNAFIKQPLPFVGWNVKTDLHHLLACLDSRFCLHNQVIQSFSIDQYIMHSQNLPTLPGLRETVRKLHLPLATTKDKAITDVEMTAEVFAYYFNHDEINTTIKQLSQQASAITINKGETLAKSSASIAPNAIPFDLKLMDGRTLPSVQLPRTIRYIICTARDHQMTKNQTKQLNTWLVGMGANHRMVQCTKPSQANFGIFVGDAKSYHQLREDQFTIKLKKLQHSHKTVISLSANNRDKK